LARPDLLDQPLPDPDLTLFMDGSSLVHKGIRWAGAAVVSLIQTLWAEPLPPSTSARLPELIALPKALQYLREKLPISIQTLSIPSWSSMPMQLFGKNEDYYLQQDLPLNTQAILDLLEASLLPKQVAVIHCPGHQ
jgi:ribonuclease HI